MRGLILHQGASNYCSQASGVLVHDWEPELRRCSSMPPLVLPPALVTPITEVTEQACFATGTALVVEESAWLTFTCGMAAGANTGKRCRSQDHLRSCNDETHVRFPGFKDKATLSPKHQQT